MALRQMTLQVNSLPIKDLILWCLDPKQASLGLKRLLLKKHSFAPGFTQEVSNIQFITCIKKIPRTTGNQFASQNNHIR